MNVLVIGRGAREHALGWKIKQSRSCGELFFAPGNWATSSLGKNIPLEPTHIRELADWASSHAIGLAVVGPESSLGLGIKDEFSRLGLPLFGPTREGAKLEASKVWAKDFLMKYNIPTPLARDFRTYSSAADYVTRRGFPLVIKADGLAEGKGVAVCGSREEALAVLKSLMVEKSLGGAGERILVEDYLEGTEISAFALCDGKRFCYFGEARDYKRAHDGDEGPNTGGMGAVSDPLLVDSALREEICGKIFKPVLAGLTEEHVVYQGVLFAGLMLTKRGPQVLEFNVRFGDPETQVLLPRVEEDFLPLLHECATGNLTGEAVSLKPEASVGVVVAAGGYPGKVEKGSPLPDLTRWPEDLLIFQGATALAEGRVVNQGGRTLTVVGMAASVSEGRKKVYEALECRDWGNYFYRKDIGMGLTPMGVSSP